MYLGQPHTLGDSTTPSRDISNPATILRITASFNTDDTFRAVSVRSTEPVVKTVRTVSQMECTRAYWRGKPERLRHKAAVRGHGARMRKLVGYAGSEP